jgi:AraC-like DNA-binding protein
LETCSDTGIEISSLGIGWAAIEGPSVIEVTAGDVIARAREEVVRARTGDLVCVAPGSRAELRAACGSARVKRPTLAPALVASALALAGTSRAQEAVGFRVDPRDSDRARQGARLIRELERAHSTGKGGHLRRIARCVELLALALESEGPQVPGAAVASRRSGRRMRFLRAIEELESTSLDEITLTSFARRAGISERHASRLFQVELGRTFREHLAGLRLERAKALLRATEMSVIEVAGETGWSSLAHFNAVFRRRVGATPTQFRIGSVRSEARRAAS